MQQLDATVTPLMEAVAQLMDQVRALESPGRPSHDDLDSRIQQAVAARSRKTRENIAEGQVVYVWRSNAKTINAE